MGHPIHSNFGRKLLWLGTIMALCGLTVLAHAEDTSSVQAANNTPSTAPTSKLQVTGNATTFSVDADHADAQSMLKAIFNQANAQFTTDSSVVGQVTLRLTDQSLTTTLDALCRQLLIRYRKDARGIYLFEQDGEAVKAVIMHLKDQNVLLRQQLRTLGLSVPEESVLDSLADATRLNGAEGAPGVGGPGQGGRGGGFGGSGGPYGRGNQLKDTAATKSQTTGARSASPAAITTPQNRAMMKLDASQNGVAPGYNYLTVDDIARIFELNPQNNTLRNPDSYRAFLKENGYVWINTGGQRTPVTEVLQELGRQSNTQILIDASVPTGPKFSLLGYITPRTLPEALNVLAQSTRLAWHWLGQRVYVEALPDFQLFYNSTSPRVIFGSSPLPTQQGVGQSQGQQGNNSPAYAQPSQPPLPITNGEKKIP